jgi:hypothetical protein
LRLPKLKRERIAFALQAWEELEGVNEGGMAMEAYLEAVAPGTAAERDREIEGELRKYCALDTVAMIRTWAVLSGRDSRDQADRSEAAGIAGTHRE